MLTARQNTLPLFLLWAITFIVGILALLGGNLLGLEYTWVPLLIILVAIGFLLRSGIRWLRQSDFGLVPLLHPPALITGWVLVLIGIPGLISLFYPDVLGDDLVYLSTVRYTHLDVALGFGLVLVGLFCLWIGYGIGLQKIKPLKTLTRFSGEVPSLFAVMLFYGLTILTEIFRILIAGINYGNEDNLTRWGGTLGLFDQLIGYVESSRFIVLAIICVQVFRGHWSKRLLIAVIAVETMSAAMSGFMKPLLWVAMVVMVSAIYAGYSMRRYVYHIAAFALLLVLLIPVTSDLRTNIKRIDSRSPSELVAAVGQSFENTWGAGLDVGLTLFSNKALGREAEVAQMPGVIMHETPSVIPYQGMQEFLSIPGFIVPRAIWQNKPFLTRGVWFSKTYLNMPEETDSSSAMTIFGECYMFGGWFAVVLGLFVLGLLLAFLFQNTAGAGAVPLYIAFIPTLIDVEGQFTVMVVMLVQTAILYSLIYMLLIKLSRVRRPSDALLDAQKRAFGITAFGPHRAGVQ